MLNQAEVLRYVKDNMAFPFQTIEWDDDKILEYIDDNTRKEFSYYIPQNNQFVWPVSLAKVLMLLIQTRGFRYDLITQIFWKEVI